MLIVLGIGLIFAFLFGATSALALLRADEHRGLRNAVLIFLLPMPLYALGMFLGASSSAWPYAVVLVLAVVLAKKKWLYPLVKESLRKRAA
jgi:Kef-type K+ transport system membrane component KefB